MEWLTHNAEAIAASVIAENDRRFREITCVVKEEFHDGFGGEERGMFIGSYGRNTAIASTTVDVLIEIPEKCSRLFNDIDRVGQKKLLLKFDETFGGRLSESGITQDGHIALNFFEGMNFKVVPAFYKNPHMLGLDYKYPIIERADRSSNPKKIQDAMEKKDKGSCGLLTDTCRCMRSVRDEFLGGSAALPGIVIDAFVYAAIGGFRWNGDEIVSNVSLDADETYEENLQTYLVLMSADLGVLNVPGENRTVECDSVRVNNLMKILKCMTASD